MDAAYTVSVRLQSFNHSKYIRETMESILSQKTTFRVEVVCGDDFSTDETLEVLKSCKGTENVHIRVLNRREGDQYWQERQRQGRLYNFTNIIENCRGKYIALLDGDDYWSDPYKLQKQVDFLDANSDCVACHHWQRIAEMDSSGNYVTKEAPTMGHGYFPEKKATVEKIFSNQLRVKSRTIMFRNILQGFPNWFYKVAYGDVPLSMILGMYGDFGFINEPMAVYRQTGKGISSYDKESPLFIFNHYIEWIKIWEYGNRHYNGKHLRKALGTIYYFYEVILKRYKYSLKICWMIVGYALLNSQLSVLRRLQVFFELSKKIMRSRFRSLQR